MTDFGGVDEKPAELERIRALAATILHPVRSLLMSVLAMEPSLGVEELAERLGVSARTVRRHIGMLVEQELVAVEREESRRGVVKRYYATLDSVQIDSREDSFLSDSERRRVSLAVIRMIVRELARAGARPEMAARADRVVVNLPGLVDSQGWRELSELHHEMLGQAKGVMADARQRLAAGAEPIPVISEQILLETNTNPDKTWNRRRHAQRKLN